jgi:phosphoacetylglucosamine mutase
MVTASHNGPRDNGLKLSDGDGGMLHHAWEARAMRLERAEGGAAVVAVLREICEEIGLPQLLTSLFPVKPRVFLGMDTRPHSVRLSNLARRGAEALGAVVVDLGVVTTPMLHHVVYSVNRGEARWADISPDKASGGGGGAATLTGYFDKISDAFRTLLKGRKISAPLVIDCACGVGSLGIAPLVESLKDIVEIQVRNTWSAEIHDKLNSGCGAEWVQKKRLPPANCDNVGGADAGVRFASFDGDADRVVYFTFAEGSTDASGFRLLDGDKIAVLTAQFVGEELEAAGLTDRVRMGIVQTAYANGAAHNTVVARGIECPYAKTGVKYCHHKAVEYDIGIYYEANGHGTAIFKDSVVDMIRAEREKNAAGGINGDNMRTDLAMERLLAVAQLYNQAVGDATADALFVEACLAVKGWSVADWDALYSDLPSRQTKVKVADRKVVVPLPDETAVVEPVTLKEAIAAAVAEVDAENGRAFARPSGTEDVVRVYAEASTVELADLLAGKVARAIYDHAGGVGDPPVAGVWK